MTKEERRIENKRIFFERKIMREIINDRKKQNSLKKKIDDISSLILSLERAEALYSGLSKIVNNLDKRIKRMEH